MFRYFIVWLGLLAIAVANGALRQFTFGNILSELRAHQLSTLSGSILIGFAVWLVVRRWPPLSDRHAFLLGLFWLFLTVAFECFMGRVLSKRSWSQVLSDYNLLAGRVWILFLVWLTTAPWLFYRLQHGNKRRNNERALAN